MRNWIGSLTSAAMALGVVSLGHQTQSTASAENKSWSYYDECINGSSCDNEEKDEYYENGDYREEVVNEPGAGNKEEMMELANDPYVSTFSPAFAESTCRTMLTRLSDRGWYIRDRSCHYAGLGY